MTIEQLSHPDYEDIDSYLSKERTLGNVIVIFGNCSVEWTGKREGEIGEGQRVVICKPDGAISVHRPTGARAVARQPIGSNITLLDKDSHIHLYAAKSSSNILRIQLFDVQNLISYDASDDVDPELNQTEKKMHEYIQTNPDAIEDGFRIIEHEYQLPQGRADFYGTDADGNAVVLEVKRPIATPEDVDQLNRYVNHFKRTEKSRARGILVAPQFRGSTRQTLQDRGLEHKKLDSFESKDVFPTQSSLDDWSS